jgi:cysteine desulfurase
MIYLDNNATTRPFPEAIEAFQNSNFGNPHSTHIIGIKANKDLEKARQMIAEDIGCDVEEVFFVSGATEACNWAIQILRDNNCNIIYNEYEHSAVLKPIMAFSPVDNPDKNGYVQMLVNNIYGEIYEIPKREHEEDLIFCDGTAGIGHMEFNFKKSSIDLLAFGAHKFNGIRGIGCLIINRRLLPVRSLIWGGDVTGGTPCSGLALAMAVALRKNLSNLEENKKHNILLRDYLIDELTKIPYSRLNGPDKEFRASNNVNISFWYMNGTELQNLLSEKDICVSTGSACSSESFVEKRGGICVRPIPKTKVREPELITIFKAGGMDPGDAESSIRITTDIYNTLDECKQTVEEIQYLLDFYRQI